MKEQIDNIDISLAFIVYVFGPSLPTSSYHLPVFNFLPSFQSSFPICFILPPLQPQLASLAVNHDWCLLVLVDGNE